MEWLGDKETRNCDALLVIDLVSTSKRGKLTEEAHL